MTTKVALSVKNVACAHVTNLHRKLKVDRKKIAQIVNEVSRRLGVSQYEICVQFVSPRKMRALNKLYRHQDKSTDVLSFPQYDWKRPLKVQSTPAPDVKILNPLPLGDVVISVDDANTNAVEYGHELAKEVCFLLVHGILHLVGHDHMKPAEKKRMFSEQKKLMRIFAGRSQANPTWTGCVQLQKRALIKSNLKSRQSRRSPKPRSSK